MIIVDDFLPDAKSVREAGLCAEYGDLHAHDGETYKRIAIAEVPGFREGIERVMGPVEMLGMAYRLNFDGELPNAAIHSDMDWGTHAAVLYLSEGEGGTAFWRHRATGASRIDKGDVALLHCIENDWDDASKWDQIALAEMKLGRCVIYESALFHSRWPFAAFGTDADTGRLIAIAFFSPRA
jgi:hypothetical protein